MTTTKSSSSFSNPSATTTTTATPTRTSIYQHEEAIANDFGQVIQKRKTLAKSALSLRDKLYILQHAPTTDALYFGLAAGLGVFWAMGRLRGGARRAQQVVVSPFRHEPKSWFPVLSPRTLRVMDATVSTWIGFQVSLWSMDTMEKQRIISNIPLQPGRSGVSEALCGVLVQEYKRQWKLDATAASNNSSESLSRRETLKQPHREDLQVLFRFIENCEKRLAVEERVRREQGLRPEEPVAVPAPVVTLLPSQDDRGGEVEWSTEDMFGLVGDQGDSSTRM